MATQGTDLVVAAWRLLDDDERESVFSEIHALREQAQAGIDSTGEELLRSLRRVTEFVGHEPSVDEYKDAVPQLLERGVVIAPFHRLVRHFGSWRLAKEALGLSEITTVRSIEARFRSRKLGKIWRYTDETLRDTLMRCTREHGRAVTVAEYDWWRERQIQTAKAKGEEIHLPSAGPYRKRFGTWEQTLAEYGFVGDDATVRFPGS
jgi:hypothetical protein